MTLLDTIGDTRLVPLRHVVPESSARVLLKLEYENPTGSMKDRMALAMAEAAERTVRLGRVDPQHQHLAVERAVGQAPVPPDARLRAPPAEARRSGAPPRAHARLDDPVEQPRDVRGRLLAGEERSETGVRSGVRVDAPDEDPLGGDAGLGREPGADPAELLRREQAHVALDPEQIRSAREMECTHPQRIVDTLGDADPRRVAHHRHAERRIEFPARNAGPQLAHRASIPGGAAAVRCRPMPGPADDRVAYEAAPSGYFEARGLRRHARVGSLWALGVGAVISGDFFGWNFGLAAGGFGGLLIATVIITIMYVGLCFSIAEMSPALPHTGGAYSFARSAFGPWGAYVTGLAENMEYVLTPAVIVVGIGGYLGAIFGTPDSWAPLWWAVAYAVFVGLNVVGVETSFRVTVAVTLLALAILAVFFVGAIPHFDLERWALAPDGEWLPHGARGILAALPFAIWFYLAIEELPLAAEEAHAPHRDMPRGILLGLATLVLTAFGTLFLNSGISPGAEALGRSEEPLFDGLRTVFGAGLGTRVLALVAVAGLVASFHSIIFAYGRQIYSLSRAGYFPRWLSITHSRHRTPHLALISGALLGYAVALTIHLLGSEHPVGAVLLNMAVFGAVISYGLQMASFIALRKRLPDLERPYRSPFGIFGAVVAASIAGVTLVALFVVDPIYQRVVIGAAIWYALGLAWFALWARRRLVLSPEESFARTARGETR